MKTKLEKVYDFLGSKDTKLLFLALLIIFVGAFFLTIYEEDKDVICTEVKIVLENNVPIEKQLISEGKIAEDKRLHRSLEQLIKQADVCDADFLRKIIHRKKQ